MIPKAAQAADHGRQSGRESGVEGAECMNCRSWDTARTLIVGLWHCKTCNVDFTPEDLNVPDERTWESAYLRGSCDEAYKDCKQIMAERQQFVDRAENAERERDKNVRWRQEAVDHANRLAQRCDKLQAIVTAVGICQFHAGAPQADCPICALDRVKEARPMSFGERITLLVFFALTFGLWVPLLAWAARIIFHR
jgi:hypothetical protein